MNIVLFGTSYKQSCIKELELVHLNHDSLTSFLTLVKQDSPMSEMVVVSTCNRVEFYFVTDDVDASIQWICHYLSRNRLVSQDRICDILSLQKGREVVTHLFQVVSGMESMVFGENEILGQIKESYQLAQSMGTTKSLLNKVFQMAVMVGKRVRSETHIGRGVCSVSSVAIDLVKLEYLGDFQNRRVLVVGIGRMGIRCVKKLIGIGCQDIWVSNRSSKPLQDICDEYPVNHWPFSDLLKDLFRWDVIVFATSAKHPIFSEESLPKILDKRLFCIDLGLPRNVTSSLRDRLHLVSLETLEEVAKMNIEHKKLEIPLIKDIISSEVTHLFEWMSHRLSFVRI